MYGIAPIGAVNIRAHGNEKTRCLYNDRAAPFDFT